jgi:Flp pilus assembly protein TadG
MLIFIFGFTALAVDLGYISLTKARLQSASDAAAFGAVMELSDSSLSLSARNQLAVTTAVDLADRNYEYDSNSLTTSDVEVGRWEAGAFAAGLEPANAVRVTTRRAAKNGNELPLFFARVFGTNTVDVTATTISILDSSAVEVVGMAVRAAGFGPIDQDVSAKNPGKDGPSEPAVDDRFQKNDQIDIGLYGKGKASPVHLALDVSASHNVQAVLRGDDDPVPMNIDDEYYVLNAGTGSNAYNVHLAKRLDYGWSDPKRTFYVPIVDTLPGSRDANGDLTGKVIVVGFIKVHLDGIVVFETPDPKNSKKTISNEALACTVLEDQFDDVASAGGSGGSPKLVQ